MTDLERHILEIKKKKLETEMSRLKSDYNGISNIQIIKEPEQTILTFDSDNDEPEVDKINQLQKNYKIKLAEHKTNINILNEKIESLEYDIQQYQMKIIVLEEKYLNSSEDNDTSQIDKIKESYSVLLKTKNSEIKSKIIKLKEKDRTELISKIENIDSLTSGKELREICNECNIDYKDKKRRQVLELIQDSLKKLKKENIKVLSDIKKLEAKRNTNKEKINKEFRQKVEKLKGKISKTQKYRDIIINYKNTISNLKQEIENIRAEKTRNEDIFDSFKKGEKIRLKQLKSQKNPKKVKFDEIETLLPISVKSEIIEEKTENEKSEKIKTFLQKLTVPPPLTPNFYKSSPVKKESFFKHQEHKLFNIKKYRERKAKLDKILDEKLKQPEIIIETTPVQEKRIVEPIQIPVQKRNSRSQRFRKRHILPNIENTFQEIEPEIIINPVKKVIPIPIPVKEKVRRSQRFRKDHTDALPEPESEKDNKLPIITKGGRVVSHKHMLNKLNKTIMSQFRSTYKLPEIKPTSFLIKKAIPKKQEILKICTQPKEIIPERNIELEISVEKRMNELKSRPGFCLKMPDNPLLVDILNKIKKESQRTKPVYHSTVPIVEDSAFCIKNIKKIEPPKLELVKYTPPPFEYESTLPIVEDSAFCVKREPEIKKRVIDIGEKFIDFTYDPSSVYIPENTNFTVKNKPKPLKRIVDITTKCIETDELHYEYERKIVPLVVDNRFVVSRELEPAKHTVDICKCIETDETHYEYKKLPIEVHESFSVSKEEEPSKQIVDITTKCIESDELGKKYTYSKPIISKVMPTRSEKFKMKKTLKHRKCDSEKEIESIKEPVSKKPLISKKRPLKRTLNIRYEKETKIPKELEILQESIQKEQTLIPKKRPINRTLNIMYKRDQRIPKVLEVPIEIQQAPLIAKKRPLKRTLNIRYEKNAPLISKKHPLTSIPKVKKEIEAKKNESIFVKYNIKDIEYPKKPLNQYEKIMRIKEKYKDFLDDISRQNVVSGIISNLLIKDSTPENLFSNESLKRLILLEDMPKLTRVVKVRRIQN